MSIENKSYKFCGGLHIGLISSTWPGGELEVTQDYLFVRDKFLRKEYKLSKTDIVSVEIKKYLPIIGYGIKISHKNKSYTWDTIYFWYVSFRFEKLVNGLKEFGWL